MALANTHRAEGADITFFSGNGSSKARVGYTGIPKGCLIRFPKWKYDIVQVSSSSSLRRPAHSYQHWFEEDVAERPRWDMDKLMQSWCQRSRPSEAASNGHSIDEQFCAALDDWASQETVIDAL
eukprot:8203483-Pyramimonas_sp.AAC.1